MLSCKMVDSVVSWTPPPFVGWPHAKPCAYLAVTMNHPFQYPRYLKCERSGSIFKQLLNAFFSVQHIIAL